MLTILKGSHDNNIIVINTLSTRATYSASLRDNSSLSEALLRLLLREYRLEHISLVGGSGTVSWSESLSSSDVGDFISSLV
jgi:hypothetical protein